MSRGAGHLLTETAWHADVVLPASARREVGHLHQHQSAGADRAAGNRSAGRGAPGLEVDPIAGTGIGLKWAYKDVSEVYTEMAEVMPSLTNITWERLVRGDAVTIRATHPTNPATNHLRTVVPDRSGRAKIVPADLLPPDELPDGSTRWY